MFFDRDRVAKEMLYVEFAAILDQVVGLAEFAGREMRAAYLRINDQLAITGCVFFMIDFDAQGYVDRQWNLPLPHLLDTAGRGPDLGAGRIRLACRSQCSVSWHQNQLWDPLLDGELNSFRLLLRAVRANRLGIPTQLDDTDQPAALPPAGSGREQQQLRIATLKSEYREQLDQLHHRYRAQLAKAEEALKASRQSLRDEHSRNQALQDRLNRQTRQFQELRERWQQELSLARDGSQLRAAALRDEFELELNARVEQATTGLREQLDRREVELLYRDEQLAGLREQLNRLRREREVMMQHSGDRVLRRLAEAGVTFVAWQPGADHMTIPLDDVAHYLEAPVDYIASHCYVTTELYRQWLSHYERPVCSAALGDEGGICAEPVARVERPNQFMPGESDHCMRHRMTLVDAGSEERLHHGS